MHMPVISTIVLLATSMGGGESDPRRQWPEVLEFCAETIDSESWVEVEDTEVEKAGVEWLKRIRAIDDYMGKPVQHIQTKHFVISIDVPKLTFERKVLKTKELSYYFAERMEELFAKFKEILPAEESDFTNRTHILIWARQADQIKGSTKFVGITNQDGCKFMGPSPIYSQFFDKSRQIGLEGLLQAVVHNVAHCLMSNVYEGYWVGQDKGGWLDAGLAHYFEIEMFGDVRHYCYREQDNFMQFKDGKWAEFAKETVVKNRQESLWPGLVKATDQLTPDEHVISWSIVDYVINEHPGTLGEVIRRTKKKETLTGIFRGALSISSAEAEEEWKSYVRKNYGRRKH